MKINSYFRFVLGEHPDQVALLHHSSIKRMKAFAIAIHIPIALWAMTGFIIASQTFQLDSAHAAAVSLFCAVLIYLVERLVLSSPKGIYINLQRWSRKIGQCYKWSSALIGDEVAKESRR